MPTWPAVLLSSNLILVIFDSFSICHHKLNTLLNVSPQTMVLCTTWSKAFQSRCPHLLVAYCCHIPHHHGSGPFHLWFRHTALTFSSHRARMLCCTGSQKTMITGEILKHHFFFFFHSKSIILTLSQSWASQCGGHSLSPQGWMAKGLFSGEHWDSGTTRPSGVLQYTCRTVFPFPQMPEHWEKIKFEIINVLQSHPIKSYLKG